MKDPQLIGEQAGRHEVLWSLPPPAPPDAIIPLCRELRIPPIIASVLWTRGFKEKAAEDLYPKLTPCPLPGIEEAVDLIQLTLQSHKRILIHGDYDADGISATAILKLGLEELGGNVQIHIPNRLTEGYGIHLDRVEEHILRADLIITVDCGISNIEEINQLKRSGVDVIVTDHHQPGQQLPDAILVHPLLANQSKTNDALLTGAGVAFHLLWALHKKLGLPDPLKYTDIAALGTIADVAPLLGDNRALVREGLECLGNTTWPGLQASLKIAGIQGAPTARDIAFTIAPRINAAGRLGEADLGLELLTTKSTRRAHELSTYLEARNSDRRHLQNTMYDQALKMVDPDAPAIVLADETWHPGVIGIVASKLVDQYLQPVFLSAKGKGSVRSPPGISAVAALQEAKDHLTRFGGHEQAAGFTIESAKFSAFREAIYGYTRSRPTPKPTLDLDAFIGPEDINRDLLKGIKKLEPLGEKIPPPRFVLTGALSKVKAVGKNLNTLQIQCNNLKGVAWQKGFLASELSEGSKVNLAISLRENFWQGKSTIEFTADQIRQESPLLPRSKTKTPNIRRGAPIDLSGSLAGSAAAPVEGKPICIKDLNFSDPFSASLSIQKEVLKGTTIFFDLSSVVITAIKQHASELPTLGEVRTGFVRLQQGKKISPNDRKQTLIGKILGELRLIDEKGFARKGQKRNPYDSETLLAALLEKYRLQGLVNAYLYADDEVFASTVKSLFS